MNKVRVITDTVACIPSNWAIKYNIKVVPAANIMVDGINYIENINLTAKQAYEFIRKDPDKFVTSATTPGRLLETYKEISNENQEIVFITLSSSLSSVHKTAFAAAEYFKNESPNTIIKILDSKNVASGEGLIVLAAAKAAAQGLNLNQVVEISEQAIQQTKGIMMLDTLRYVYRTGRMSKMSSKLASLLNIRPINHVTLDGKIEMLDKVRDRETGIKKMFEHIRKTVGETEGMQFMITHADALDSANQVNELLKTEFHAGEEVVIGDYSPVMGYGAGPGAIFIGYRPHISISKM
jgi:uncharacterized protein